MNNNTPSWDYILYLFYLIVGRIFLKHMNHSSLLKNGYMVFFNDCITKLMIFFLSFFFVYQNVARKVLFCIKMRDFLWNITFLPFLRQCIFIFVFDYIASNIMVKSTGRQRMILYRFYNSRLIFQWWWW